MSLPVAASRQTTTSWSFCLVCVNTRPPTTATDEKPPDSGAFHSCRGPSLGHSLSRPVSREIPSKRGPRHRGQSSARAHGPGHAARNASAAQASPTPLLNGNDMTDLLLRTARERGSGARLLRAPARNNSDGKATHLVLHRQERMGTLRHLFSQSSPWAVGRPPARKHRQAHRRRPARPRRTVPVNAAVLGIPYPGRLPREVERCETTS